MFRLLLSLLLMAIVPVAVAQTDTFHYYVNHSDKPVEAQGAIYHLVVYKEKPSDIYWKWNKYWNTDNRLRATGSTADKEGRVKQGAFVFYNVDGHKESAGDYRDDKPDGGWTYWTDDKISALKFHRNGHLAGLNRSWFSKGAIKDSVVLNDNGDGTGIGFFESGNLMYKGSYTAGKKEGRWEYYYDKRGQPTNMEITFAADSVANSRCYTADGQPLTECIYEREAAFAGGDDAWRSYLISKLEGGPWANWMKKTNVYKLMLRFIVDKDGTVSDIRVESSDGIKKLDKLAVKIMEQSPAWAPAIQYNQKVKAYRRQPMTYMVGE